MLTYGALRRTTPWPNPSQSHCHLNRVLLGASVATTGDNTRCAHRHQQHATTRAVHTDTNSTRQHALCTRHQQRATTRAVHTDTNSTRQHALCTQTPTARDNTLCAHRPTARDNTRCAHRHQQHATTRTVHTDTNNTQQCQQHATTRDNTRQAVNKRTRQQNKMPNRDRHMFTSTNIGLYDTRGRENGAETSDRNRRLSADTDSHRQRSGSLEQGARRPTRSTEHRASGARRPTRSTEHRPSGARRPTRSTECPQHRTHPTRSTEHTPCEPPTHTHTQTSTTASARTRNTGVYAAKCDYSIT